MSVISLSKISLKSLLAVAFCVFTLSVAAPVTVFADEPETGETGGETTDPTDPGDSGNTGGNNGPGDFEGSGDREDFGGSKQPNNPEPEQPSQPSNDTPSTENGTASDAGQTTATRSSRSTAKATGSTTTDEPSEGEPEVAPTEEVVTEDEILTPILNEVSNDERAVASNRFSVIAWAVLGVALGIIALVSGTAFLMKWLTKKQQIQISK